MENRPNDVREDLIYIYIVTVLACDTTVTEIIAKNKKYRRKRKYLAFMSVYPDLTAVNSDLT